MPTDRRTYASTRPTVHASNPVGSMSASRPLPRPRQIICLSSCATHFRFRCGLDSWKGAAYYEWEQEGLTNGQCAVVEGSRAMGSTNTAGQSSSECRMRNVECRIPPRRILCPFSSRQHPFKGSANVEEASSLFDAARCRIYLALVPMLRVGMPTGPRPSAARHVPCSIPHAAWPEARATRSTRHVPCAKGHAPGSLEQAAGYKEQASRSLEQGAGYREHASRSLEQITRSWPQIVYASHLSIMI